MNLEQPVDKFEFPAHPFQVAMVVQVQNLPGNTVARQLSAI